MHSGSGGGRWQWWWSQLCYSPRPTTLFNVQTFNVQRSARIPGTRQLYTSLAPLASACSECVRVRGGRGLGYYRLAAPAATPIVFDYRVAGRLGRGGGPHHMGVIDPNASLSPAHPESRGRLAPPSSISINPIPSHRIFLFFFIVVPIISTYFSSNHHPFNNDLAARDAPALAVQATAGPASLHDGYDLGSGSGSRGYGGRCSCSCWNRIASSSPAVPTPP